MSRPPAPLSPLLLASPWPPVKSEIARHVAEVLCPALQAQFQVVPLGDPGSAPWPDVGGQSVLPVDQGLAQFPHAPLLAHLGNESLQNKAALQALRQRPGVVVMHDVVLHLARYNECMRQGRFADYLADVRAHGGAAMAERAQLAQFNAAVVHRLVPSVPLFEPYLHHALGVVVHSQMALDTVAERGPWPVRRLNLPAPPPSDPSVVLAHRAQQAAELAKGQPLRLMVFGHLGRNRCLPQVLDAVALLRAQGTVVTLDVYGDFAEPEAREQAVARSGLATGVTVHGFVPTQALDHALQQAHLAVNLRSPTMGEASASQLRLYAAGLPALVSQVGWYAEQPGTAVRHVPPSTETEGVVSAVRALLAAPDQLVAMAAAGLAHLSQQHAPGAYVAQLAEFMAECAHSGPAHRRARRYVQQATAANAHLQLPLTPRLLEAVAHVSGPGVLPSAIEPALARAHALARSEVLNHATPNPPMQATAHPAPKAASKLGTRGAAAATGCATDLAALADRARPRAHVPERLAVGTLSGPLVRLGLGRWLLKVWNFVSREWREPTELAHRVLQAHDAMLNDLRDAQAQLAQLKSEAKQQVLVVQAELVAAEDRIAQLESRWQASAASSGAHPGTGPAGPSVSASDEQAFVLAVGDRFRGDPALLAARLSVHLPAVAAAMDRVLGPSPRSGAAAGVTTPLVDLGCGRGDWLELVRSAGHPALGVDNAVACVSACQDKGLNAVVGDALGKLRQLASNSVAVVTAFHLVEHLPLGGQVALFKEAWRVLAPGGLFLVETPNPENLNVISRNFWHDPTHQRPVPAEMLVLLARSAGFEQTETEFLQPSPVPPWEPEHHTPRLRHMLFCGEDTALRAIK